LRWSAHLDEFCRNGALPDLVHDLKRGRNRLGANYSCVLLFRCQVPRGSEQHVRDVSRRVAGFAGQAIDRWPTAPPCTQGTFCRTGHSHRPDDGDRDPPALTATTRHCPTGIARPQLRSRHRSDWSYESRVVPYWRCRLSPPSPPVPLHRRDRDDQATN
jgi:hypothetical protein